MKQVREAYFNQKGGAGKSASALLRSDWEVMKQRKTLVIDTDPQASITKSLLNPRGSKTSYSAVLLGEKDDEGNELDIRDFIIPIRENLDILPANKTLTACRSVGESKLKRIVRTILRDLKEYDSIIIDCPPSIDNLSAFGILMANYVILPIELEFFPYSALQEANEAIADLLELHDYFDKTLYFINKKTESKEKLKEKYEEKYSADLGEALLPYSLPKWVGISERTGGRYNLFEQKNVNPRVIEFFEKLEKELRGAE